MRIERAAAVCATASMLPRPARTIACGSTRRASRTTESTAPPTQLSDDDLSLGGYGYRQFGVREMPELLARIDEIMQVNDCQPAHLVAVGGVSMLIRVPGRQTGDLDIVSEGLNHDVRNAGRIVASENNLAPDWINDGAKGFAVSVDVEPERIFTGKRIVVDSAGPKYLLAMKLL